MPYLLETFLAGQSLTDFIASTWQQTARHYRHQTEMPGLSLEDSLHLAMHDEVRSRLLLQEGGAPREVEGPFDKKRLHHIKECAALQIQHAECFEAELARLWLAFAPLSFARLDGIEVRVLWPGMHWPVELVSGDQFIFQLHGQSHWRQQRDSQHPFRQPLPVAPLGFALQPAVELAAGEMFYVPAGSWCSVAAPMLSLLVLVHTRSFADRELVEAFLQFLMQRPQPQRALQDQALVIADAPAAVPEDWLTQRAELLNGIRWSREELLEFLGLYLSRPDPQTFFEAPRHPLGPDAFSHRLAAHGVVLTPALRLFYRGDSFYCNGESFCADDGAAECFRPLADQRQLPPGCYAGDVLNWLYEAYTLGLVSLAASAE